MNQLDPGKLTSVDEHGSKMNIIPAEVRGFFRKHRTWSQIILLFIFLVLPWTSINGHQTILLDVANREFALFGTLFKAHDAPLVFFILGVLVLGLAFVTSIWGRIWCGWACPQTVFIDAVFRRIEVLVEGTHLQRRRLKDSPWTAEKMLRSSLKWILFIGASSIIAHSFIAYFAGAKVLMEMTQKAPSENYTYFALVLMITGLVLFDFVWFREQFCIIMCPYGRIQSVLLDEKSLAVVYDTQRGEPRKGLVTSGSRGDCVDCKRCVNVCPTGIDIRNGLQMECIACTSCIDACDEIMDKVKKPRGLIRYNTLDGSPVSVFKPRSILYMSAIFVIFSWLVYSLSSRQTADFTIIRGVGLPYSQIKNERNEDIILNQFKVHIQNQGDTFALYKMSLADEFQNSGIDLNVAENPLRLGPNDLREWFFFIKVKPEFFKNLSRQNIKIHIQDLNQENHFDSVREITLLGPNQ